MANTARFYTMTYSVDTFFANLFGLIFRAIALVLIIAGFVEFYNVYFEGQVEFMVAVISAINTFVIALAIFELGSGVHEEYKSNDTGTYLYSSMRRTITRFVGTVCIALSLEALIMIIKYSKLELVGNLWYPVGIITSTALLLASLALFLHLTKTIKTPSGEASD